MDVSQHSYVVRGEPLHWHALQTLLSRTEHTVLHGTMRERHSKHTLGFGRFRKRGERVDHTGTRARPQHVSYGDDPELEIIELVQSGIAQIPDVGMTLSLQQSLDQIVVLVGELLLKEIVIALNDENRHHIRQSVNQVVEQTYSGRRDLQLVMEYVSAYHDRALFSGGTLPDHF